MYHCWNNSEEQVTTYGSHPTSSVGYTVRQWCWQTGICVGTVNNVCINYMLHVGVKELAATNGMPFSQVHLSTGYQRIMMWMFSFGQKILKSYLK